MMEEKTYKVMRGTGVANLICGVICIATGLSVGVLMIIAGAKLLAQKSKILF